MLSILSVIKMLHDLIEDVMGIVLRGRPVSYTHLDVYKRQVLYVGRLYLIVRTTQGIGHRDCNKTR